MLIDEHGGTDLAYIPGYEWDIFVSYARLDNQPSPGRDPWVDTFLRSLDNSLRSSFGQGADDLKIFLDVAAFEANSQLPELLAHVRASALFLAICSPSYEARAWTRQELQEFWQHPQDAKRVFAIEKQPLDKHLSYPPPLQTHNRVILWKPAPLKNVPVSILPADPDWFFDVVKLALDIKDKLKSMHEDAATSPRPAPTTAPPAGTSYRRVLLAQTGEALWPAIKELRTYLDSYGVPVRPSRVLPQGGAAFAAAFQAELNQSDLFVQLLSDSPGLQPPDLPQGYPRFQYDSAKAKGINILQWRHPEMNLSDIDDPDHALLIAGEHVKAEGFVAFKAMVLRAAEPPPPPAAPPQEAPAANVFIGSHALDNSIADQVAGAIAAHGYDPFVWERARQFGPLDPDSRANRLREELEAALAACDGMALIYGPHGSRAMGRNLYNQYRRMLGKKRQNQAVKPLAFIYADPHDNDKETSLYLGPEVLHIHAPDGVTEEVLRPVLRALQDHWGTPP